MKHKAHHKIKKHLDGMAKHHAAAMKHISMLEKHEKAEMKGMHKGRGRPRKEHNPY